jgi:hypothetical protein
MATSTAEIPARRDGSTFAYVVLLILAAVDARRFELHRAVQATRHAKISPQSLPCSNDI